MMTTKTYAYESIIEVINNNRASLLSNGYDENLWIGTGLSSINEPSMKTSTGTTSYVTAHKLPARPILWGDILCDWTKTTLNMSDDGTANGYKIHCDLDTTYKFRLSKYSGGAWAVLDEYDTASAVAPAVAWGTIKWILYYDHIEVAFGGTVLCSSDTAFRGTNRYLYIQKSANGDLVYFKNFILCSIAEGVIDFLHPLSCPTAWASGISASNGSIVLAANYDIVYRPFLGSKSGWAVNLDFRTAATDLRFGVKSPDGCLGAYVKLTTSGLNKTLSIYDINDTGEASALATDTATGSWTTLQIGFYEMKTGGVFVSRMCASLDISPSPLSIVAVYEPPNGSLIYLKDLAASSITLNSIYLSSPSINMGFKQGSTAIFGLIGSFGMPGGSDLGGGAIENQRRL